MALQISGTTVIDNDKNLVNVNSIFTTVTPEQSSNKTLGNREFCNVTTGGRTITLPASPQPGWQVVVGIDTTSTDTTVARNGQKIMGLDEDMIIDYGNISVTFSYTNSTRGWRIV